MPHALFEDVVGAELLESVGVGLARKKHRDQERGREGGGEQERERDREIDAVRPTCAEVLAAQLNLYIQPSSTKLLHPTSLP